jgi:hypothetical protein
MELILQLHKQLDHVQSHAASNPRRSGDYPPPTNVTISTSSPSFSGVS